MLSQAWRGLRKKKVVARVETGSDKGRGVQLAGHTVAMATYFVAKMIKSCSSMIR